MLSACLLNGKAQEERGWKQFRKLEATMDNLITDAYLDLTGADVAFSHGWRYGASVLPGEVTVGDLWQMIPTNLEVFTIEMTGKEIRQKLEESLQSVYAPDAFNQKGRKWGAEKSCTSEKI
jgi:2',3'-cyclic-nucleotide 2'-phosphodiesterase (5'-nucleotidase family)